MEELKGIQTGVRDSEVPGCKGLFQPLENLIQYKSDLESIIEKYVKEEYGSESE